MSSRNSRTLSQIEVANRLWVASQIKRQSASHFVAIGDLYRNISKPFADVCLAIAQMDHLAAEILDDRLLTNFSQQDGESFRLEKIIPQMERAMQDTPLLQINKMIRGGIVYKKTCKVLFDQMADFETPSTFQTLWEKIRSDEEAHIQLLRLLSRTIDTQKRPKKINENRSERKSPRFQGFLKFLGFRKGQGPFLYRRPRTISAA